MISITCKRATELLSKRLEQRLTLRERFSLYIHLRICCFCKNFAIQIAALRKILRCPSSEVTAPDKKLDPAVAERIKRKIKSA